MKKLLNCKIIVALVICLTMFAGLAMTASAAPATKVCPRCSWTTNYEGTVSAYCNTCGKTQSVYKYRCSNYSSLHVCYFCPSHNGWV